MQRRSPCLWNPHRPLRVTVAFVSSPASSLAGLDHVSGRTLSFVLLPDGLESNAVELVYLP